MYICIYRRYVNGCIISNKDRPDGFYDTDVPDEAQEILII